MWNRTSRRGKEKVSASGGESECGRECEGVEER